MTELIQPALSTEADPNLNESLHHPIQLKLQDHINSLDSNMKYKTKIDQIILSLKLFEDTDQMFRIIDKAMLSCLFTHLINCLLDMRWMRQKERKKTFIIDAMRKASENQSDLDDHFQYIFDYLLQTQIWSETDRFVKILQNTSEDTDVITEEDIKFLCNERMFVIILRLQCLFESQLIESAFFICRKVRICLQTLREEHLLLKTTSDQQKKLLTDFYLSCLTELDRKKLVVEINDLNNDELYQLILRNSKLNRDCTKLSEARNQLLEISAKYFVAKVTLTPVDQIHDNLIDEFSKVWEILIKRHREDDTNFIKLFFEKVFEKAESKLVLVACDVMRKFNNPDWKNLLWDKVFSIMTIKLNKLEKMKYTLPVNVEEVITYEKELVFYYKIFSNFLRDNNQHLYRECMLTLYSLSPCHETENAVDAEIFDILASKAKELKDFLKNVNSNMTKNDILRLATFFDAELIPEDCMLQTMDYAKDLPTDTINDVIMVVMSPRLKLLTWSINVVELKCLMRTLLEPGQKRLYIEKNLANANDKLTHVKVVARDYSHLPLSLEFPGIEKGYEDYESTGDECFVNEELDNDGSDGKKFNSEVNNEALNSINNDENDKKNHQTDCINNFINKDLINQSNESNNYFNNIESSKNKRKRKSNSNNETDDLNTSEIFQNNCIGIKKGRSRKSNVYRNKDGSDEDDWVDKKPRSARKKINLNMIDPPINAARRVTRLNSSRLDGLNQTAAAMMQANLDLETAIKLSKIELNTARTYSSATTSKSALNENVCKKNEYHTEKTPEKNVKSVGEKSQQNLGKSTSDAAIKDDQIVEELLVAATGTSELPASCDMLMSKTEEEIIINFLLEALDSDKVNAVGDEAMVDVSSLPKSDKNSMNSDDIIEKDKSKQLSLSSSAAVAVAAPLLTKDASCKNLKVLSEKVIKNPIVMDDLQYQLKLVSEELNNLAINYADTNSLVELFGIPHHDQISTMDIFSQMNEFIEKELFADKKRCDRQEEQLEPSPEQQQHDQGDAEDQTENDINEFRIVQPIIKTYTRPRRNRLAQENMAIIYKESAQIHFTAQCERPEQKRESEMVVYDRSPDINPEVVEVPERFQQKNKTVSSVRYLISENIAYPSTTENECLAIPSTSRQSPYNFVNVVNNKNTSTIQKNIINPLEQYNQVSSSNNNINENTNDHQILTCKRYCSGHDGSSVDCFFLSTENISSTTQKYLSKNIRPSISQDLLSTDGGNESDVTNQSDMTEEDGEEEDDDDLSTCAQMSSDDENTNNPPKEVHAFIRTHYIHISDSIEIDKEQQHFSPTFDHPSFNPNHIALKDSDSRKWNASVNHNLVQSNPNTAANVINSISNSQHLNKQITHESSSLVKLPLITKDNYMSIVGLKRGTTEKLIKPNLQNHSINFNITPFESIFTSNCSVNVAGINNNKKSQQQINSNDIQVGQNKTNTKRKESQKGKSIIVRPTCFSVNLVNENVKDINSNRTNGTKKLRLNKLIITGLNTGQHSIFVSDPSTNNLSMRADRNLTTFQWNESSSSAQQPIECRTKQAFVNLERVSYGTLLQHKCNVMIDNYKIQHPIVCLNKINEVAAQKYLKLYSMSKRGQQFETSQAQSVPRQKFSIADREEDIKNYKTLKLSSVKRINLQSAGVLPPTKSHSSKLITLSNRNFEWKRHFENNILKKLALKCKQKTTKSNRSQVIKSGQSISANSLKSNQTRKKKTQNDMKNVLKVLNEKMASKLSYINRQQNDDAECRHLNGKRSLKRTLEEQRQEHATINARQVNKKRRQQEPSQKRQQLRQRHRNNRKTSNNLNNVQPPNSKQPLSSTGDDDNDPVDNTSNFTMNKVVETLRGKKMKLVTQQPKQRRTKQKDAKQTSTKNVSAHRQRITESELQYNNHLRKVMLNRELTRKINEFYNRNQDDQEYERLSESKNYKMRIFVQNNYNVGPPFQHSQHIQQKNQTARFLPLPQHPSYSERYEKKMKNQKNDMDDTFSIISISDSESDIVSPNDDADGNAKDPLIMNNEGGSVISDKRQLHPKLSAHNAKIEYINTGIHKDAMSGSPPRQNHNSDDFNDVENSMNSATAPLAGPTAIGSILVSDDSDQDNAHSSKYSSLSAPKLTYFKTKNRKTYDCSDSLRSTTQFRQNEFKIYTVLIKNQHLKGHRYEDFIDLQSKHLAKKFDCRNHNFSLKKYYKCIKYDNFCSDACNVTLIANKSYLIPLSSSMNINLNKSEENTKFFSNTIKKIKASHTVVRNTRKTLINWTEKMDPKSKLILNQLYTYGIMHYDLLSSTYPHDKFVFDQSSSESLFSNIDQLQIDLAIQDPMDGKHNVISHSQSLILVLIIVIFHIFAIEFVKLNCFMILLRNFTISFFHN